LVWPKLPTCPVGEPTQMMRPPSPCSRIRTAAARVQVKVPRRWVVMTASKSSSVIFHNVVSRRMPALLTSTSSRPNSSTARSARAWAASPVPTGTTSATAVPPASVRVLTAASATAASTSLTTTAAPERASSVA
jgi:hypothetical protein